MENDVQQMTEDELDRSIEEMREKIEGEVERRHRLLAELQKIRKRRETRKDAEGRQEIERLKKEIDGL
ncbi:hypothetical protein AMJ57_01865 [Parcubacteria bacterium SG8_24]|nr:MAG: hypothetical protein AMJ57_01865 [Parcubacteria bacterium SG8_24]